MKAIILAAGIASRLRPLTEARPKCLLPLHGQSMLTLQLELLGSLGMQNVIVVAGYKAAAVREELGQRGRLIEYPDFALTNNLGTLHYCRALLDGEVLILFSDVLFEPSVIADCRDDTRDIVLLIDELQTRPETMRVKIERGSISDIGKHLNPSESHGSFVGVTKLSSAGTELLRRELDAMADRSEFKQDYYTAAFRRLARRGHAVDFSGLDGRPWLEIDTPSDYAAAQQQTFYLRE